MKWSPVSRGGYLNHIAHGVDNISTQAEAIELIEKHKESIEYLSKFGNSLEKAIVQAVISLAEVEY